MRELKLDADQSHHLLACARTGVCSHIRTKRTDVWSQIMKEARTELIEQQEQERKRPAEGQPEGIGAAKRDRHCEAHSMSSILVVTSYLPDPGLFVLPMSRPRSVLHDQQEISATTTAAPSPPSQPLHLQRLVFSAQCSAPLFSLTDCGCKGRRGGRGGGWG
jgi:hypothetical protein